MTYEELIATMDKNEAIFRVLTQVRGGCKLHCLKCAYWNEIGGRWQCGMPSEEANCRKEFDKWLKTEAE
jgi:hypothetical protein